MGEHSKEKEEVSKEASHARRLSGNGQAAPGVEQHGFNLFSSYAGKPCEEVIHAGAVFQIHKESLDWNSRAGENPGAADFFGRPFNRRARAPIKHVKRLTDAMHASKFVSHVSKPDHYNGHLSSPMSKEMAQGWMKAWQEVEDRQRRELQKETFDEKFESLAFLMESGGLFDLSQLDQEDQAARERWALLQSRWNRRI